jgi:hypothetical protein
MADGYDFGWMSQGPQYSLGAGGFDLRGLEQALSPVTGSQAGGGAWSDIMNSIGSVSRMAAPIIGLGTAGLGLYSGIKGMKEAANIREQNEEALQTQRSAAQTALGSGQQLTTAGTSALMGGPLPGGLEEQAKQYEDALRAQVRNYLAKTGNATSSAGLQWDNYIRQQSAIYRSQLAQGLIQPGQGALNIASGAASRAVGQNQATQTGLGQVLESANRALASMQAAGGAAAGPRPAAQMEEERRRRAAGGA